MKTISEATVQASSGGFGLYERNCEGPQACEGISTLNEWIAQAEENTGGIVDPAPEIDGKIGSQNGGAPYKITYNYNADGGDVAEVSYHLVYCEDCESPTPAPRRGVRDMTQIQNGWIIQVSIPDEGVSRVYDKVYTIDGKATAEQDAIRYSHTPDHAGHVLQVVPHMINDPGPGLDLTKYGIR